SGSTPIFHQLIFPYLFTQRLSALCSPSITILKACSWANASGSSISTLRLAKSTSAISAYSSALLGPDLLKLSVGVTYILTFPSLLKGVQVIVNLLFSNLAVGSAMDTSPIKG